MKNKNLSGGLFAAKPTPLTIRETPLSAQIAEWLDVCAIYNDRLNCGKVKTERGHWITLCKTGTPDRFAIIRGQIVFIEVKKFGCKTTEEQQTRHYELRESGAIIIVADSFDNFVNQLKAIRAEIESQTKEINLYE